MVIIDDLVLFDSFSYTWCIVPLFIMSMYDSCIRCSITQFPDAHLLKWDFQKLHTRFHYHNADYTGKPIILFSTETMNNHTSDWLCFIRGIQPLCLRTIFIKHLSTIMWWTKNPANMSAVANSAKGWDNSVLWSWCVQSVTRCGCKMASPLPVLSSVTGRTTRGRQYISIHYITVDVSWPTSSVRWCTVLLFLSWCARNLGLFPPQFNTIRCKFSPNIIKHTIFNLMYRRHHILHHFISK